MTKRLLLLFILCVSLVACEASVGTQQASKVMQNEDELIVSFFNVGQGDATLLQTKDITILIDAGRHDREDVVELLHGAGVEEIDLFVGTHPHADHIGQADRVLQSFPVEEVWMSGDTHTTRTFERTIAAIASSDVNYYEPRAGEVFDIGSLRIEVLNPSELTGDFHEGAIGLRVDHGEVGWLFMADIEVDVELDLVDAGVNLEADVIRLGHHGSSTSSHEDFLDQVNARYAVYSAGVDNEYGHPHREVIERLNQRPLEWFGTDLHGNIYMKSDGENIVVELEKEPSGKTEATSEVPCIDVNVATIEELSYIVHIGEERAEELVTLRPIKDLKQLTDIHGIGQGRLSDILDEEVACLYGGE
ncbi:MBL fold metallo-hydrolase [Bacillus sp. FJAT-45037]|uniref:MBL fold metallo-hydrolase n=1 Tax=Bacillus sp. FJAT-45037 TaxID=2011007 RepID=UPI000C23290C|nr:MBL fold metallo-hydrolase [Bacillus sp. FJAT-45037]